MAPKPETIELNMLLEAIFQRYGYDFRNYSKASIKRRVNGFLADAGCDTISALQHLVLHRTDAFEKLLNRLSVNVTEMFRDPGFYLALKEKVFPELSNKSRIKIWHAGCATGGEAYSLAIMLKEAGLYEKSRLYAMDIDDISLARARDAIYPARQIRDYTRNYNKAGGTGSFSQYYTAQYDHAILEQSLKENIVFSNHNLAGDTVFGEMDLIICRNVLIYFDRILQERVFRLFKESLCAGGILCLGTKETVRISDLSDNFGNVDAAAKIYRKIA